MSEAIVMGEDPDFYELGPEFTLANFLAEGPTHEIDVEVEDEGRPALEWLNRLGWLLTGAIAAIVAYISGGSLWVVVGAFILGALLGYAIGVIAVAVLTETEEDENGSYLQQADDADDMYTVIGWIAGAIIAVIVGYALPKIEEYAQDKLPNRNSNTARRNNSRRTWGL